MNFSLAAASLASATTAILSATSVSGLAVAPKFVPDASAFAYGLPGSLDPVPDFDPLGFTKEKDYETVKAYREAELQHGRVAMLGALGMLVTEQPLEFHPLFLLGGKDIGPAIRHLDEVRAAYPEFFDVLVVGIGALELNRALIGWSEPGDANSGGPLLKDDYFPGDVGFDPLNLAPTDPAEFYELHTKELQNGRLAMLGWAGMVAQELTNGKEIFVNAGLAEDKFDPSSLPVQF